MSNYIYQLAGWPGFKWDEKLIAPLLTETRHRQGRLLGRMEALGFGLQEEANLSTLALEVVKSSEIEGEVLNAEEVRSSIARRLGIETGNNIEAGRDVEGVVEMVMDAVDSFRQPLTTDRLFGWHSALFPSGRSGSNQFHRITKRLFKEFTDCRTFIYYTSLLQPLRKKCSEQYPTRNSEFLEKILLQGYSLAAYLGDTKLI